MNTNPPSLGQTVTCYGVLCRIVAIHPFGTLDVEAVDGSGRCFRMTGLSFLTPQN